MACAAGIALFVATANGERGVKRAKVTVGTMNRSSTSGQVPQSLRCRLFIIYFIIYWFN